MKTKELVVCDSFICVMGINEGYFHNNDPHESLNPDVGKDIQQIADRVHSETGNYIGVVITPAKVIYREVWGCPTGGELVYVLSGNGYFDSLSEERKQKWKDAVETFILKIKDHFKQSTVQVEWSTKIIVRYT